MKGGVIEPASEPRRSGRRGPAGVAWLPVTDHWEWFRRVAAARKVRETDPVMPLLRQSLHAAQAAAAGDPAATVLAERLTAFVEFASRFTAESARWSGPTRSRSNGCSVSSSRLDDRTLDRLLELLGSAPEDDLAKAARTMSGLSPTGLKRLLLLASQPGVTRVLGRGSTRR